MNISNLNSIRASNPKLAEALASIGFAIDTISSQTGAQPQGNLPTPIAPPSLTVFAMNGAYNAVVGAPPPSGAQYHLEYSASNNFSSFSSIPLGARNSSWSGSLGQSKLYFRVRSIGLSATAPTSEAVYHGSSTSPTAVESGSSASTPGVAEVAAVSGGGGGSGGGGFIPPAYSPPAIPANVTGLAVTSSIVVLDGCLFTKLHVTYDAPATVSGQTYTFQGIILAVSSLQGSTYPQAISQQEFTGLAGGAAVLDVFVASSTDTVTVYAVQYSTAMQTPNDWTTTASVAGVALNPGISAPPAPTSFVGSARTAAAVLTWVGVTSPAVQGYRVYRSTTNTFSTAVAIGISPAIQGLDANGNTPLGQFRDDTAVSATTYFYWLTTVLLSPVESSPTASVTVTPT